MESDCMELNHEVTKADIERTVARVMSEVSQEMLINLVTQARRLDDQMNTQIKAASVITASLVDTICRQLVQCDSIEEVGHIIKALREAAGATTLGE